MMGENHGVEFSNEGREKIVSDSSPFDSFPEDCISKIVSFTSPRDACVAATVSKAFESAVKSDVVWEKFLPPGYESLAPQSLDFSSKKELYFALFDQPVLIDYGTKSMWLEKESGKKCLMLFAMNLAIIGGDDVPCEDIWVTDPEEGYKRASKLFCWFMIRARTNTHVLSPRTRYSAYLVFKVLYLYFNGFDGVPIKAEVGFVGREVSTRTICFEMDVDDDEREMGWIYSEWREDGWKEVELGEFFTGDNIIDNEEILMTASEIRELGWKRGLLVQGIEIRPAKIQ